MLQLGVYKDLIISTIVDTTQNAFLCVTVYKDLIISTIVDGKGQRDEENVYKDLIISTIVDNIDFTKAFTKSIKT